MLFLKAVHLVFIFIWLGCLWTATWIGREKKGAIGQLSARTFYLTIDLPAMVIALGTGVALFIGKGVDMKQGWLHLKLTAVFLLVLVDLLTGFLLKKERTRQGKFVFKILHSGVLLLPMVVLFSIYVLKNK